MQLGDISYWYRSMGGLPEPRASLTSDTTVDVVIIGAGYTGLWTAYYLMQAQPSLRIAIVEQKFAGFGASGRNGGWLTGGFAWSHQEYLRQGSPESVRNLVGAMNATVQEIARVVDHEGIDAELYPTEELLVATNAAQWQRLCEEASLRQFWGESDQIYLLDQSETLDRIRLPQVVGAMAIRGVARVQPAKLVRGLAEVVERLGVEIYENTLVTDFGGGYVRGNGHLIKAGAVIRATEGYSANVSNSVSSSYKREWIPLNSAQIITAPLSSAQWQQIGWNGREIIGDYRHQYFYAQRTQDGRIAFGGRGNPYRFGSKVDCDGTPDDVTVRRLIESFHGYFPNLKSIQIDHSWCGVLGAPRHWCAAVHFDPQSRVGSAGGYVGVGVSTSNLAGRTLVEAILDKEYTLRQLPWFNLPIKQWEPEPFRWLGIHAMYKLYAMADSHEKTHARPSLLAKLGSKLTGR